MLNNKLLAATMFAPLHNYLQKKMSFDNMVALINDENADVIALKRLCVYLLRIVFPCRSITQLEAQYID